jgi:hypothetical protein
MYNNTQRYQRRVGQLSILAGIVAFASFFFMAAGTAFHFEVFSEPEKILGMNDADSQYLKWSMILDMFGYYLLLLPALFYFKNYLKKKTAWYQLLTWCGSAYIFLGAMGAAILSVVCPNLMVNYPISTAAEQTVILHQYRLVLEIVHGGMWNTLEILLAGTWWLGIAQAVKTERPAFGIISLLLAISCFLDGFGNILGLAGLAELGLNSYLLLAITWSIWFGFGLLNQRKYVKVGDHTRKKILDTDRRFWSLVN